jgi:hypothetical protein
MIGTAEPGAYVARWKQGHPPENIWEWLNGAGVAPNTRVLRHRRVVSAIGQVVTERTTEVEVHFDNEKDAFMCWMAFSDDLVSEPRRIGQ